MCNCEHHCCELEELKEMTPEERYVKRLGYRKETLRHVSGYLASARQQIWAKKGITAAGCTIGGNLLIGLEIIERYIRQQLNWELKEKGLNPLKK